MWIFIGCSVWIILSPAWLPASPTNHYIWKKNIIPPFRQNSELTAACAQKIMRIGYSVSWLKQVSYSLWLVADQWHSYRWHGPSPSPSPSVTQSLLLSFTLSLWACRCVCLWADRCVYCVGGDCHVAGLAQPLVQTHTHTHFSQWWSCLLFPVQFSQPSCRPRLV